jgi:hypothetical protein
MGKGGFIPRSQFDTFDGNDRYSSRRFPFASSSRVFGKKLFAA